MGSVVKGIFGGGDSAGALGTGQFRAKTRDVDQAAFKEKLAGTGTQEELRKKQRAQTERQEAAATGKAPSIAEAELKSATNRSLAQQLAAAKGSRGGSASARERQLAKGQATARRDISEQAAIAKLKERQLAEQSLATQLQNQRAQDIELASADRASRQALEDLLVKQNLGAQGLNLSGQQSAAQQRGGLIGGIASGIGSIFSDKNLKKDIKSESKSKKSLAKSLSDEDTKIRTKEERIAYNKEQASKGVELAKKRRSEKKSEEKKNKVAKIGKAIGEAFKPKGNVDTSYGKNLASRMASEISDEDKKQNMQSHSDENVKENKEDFNPKSFLDALKPYSYEYKEEVKNAEKGGEGRYLSCMAQDIEKAGPVGKSMVETTPEGHKQVNYGKGFGAILAAQAHLNERLADLEKKKK